LKNLILNDRNFELYREDGKLIYRFSNNCIVSCYTDNIIMFNQDNETSEIQIKISELANISGGDASSPVSGTLTVYEFHDFLIDNNYLR